MKTILKKTIIYLAIGSALLLGCFEFKNIKIIVGDDTSLGLALDLSEIEMVCRFCPSQQENPNAEPIAASKEVEMRP